MPRIPRRESRNAERAADEFVVLAARLKFVHKALPSAGQLIMVNDPDLNLRVIDRLLVRQVVPVVRTLAVLPSQIFMVFEKFQGREVLHKGPKPYRRQEAADIVPGVRLPVLEDL